VFSPADASRVFRPDNLNPNSAARGGLALRWIFASDLFHNVILADRPAQKAVPVDSRLELYRRGALGAVCGLCLLLTVAFFSSWAGNRELLHEIKHAGTAVLKPGDMLAELRSLDELRLDILRLREGATWPLHWGLYSGDGLLPAARAHTSDAFNNFCSMI